MARKYKYKYKYKYKTEYENREPVDCDFCTHEGRDTKKQPGEAVYMHGVWMCYDCMKDILRRHGIDTDEILRNLGIDGGEAK